MTLGTATLTLRQPRQAIDLITQALAIGRDTSDRYLEADALDYLGRSWLVLGNTRPRRAATSLKTRR